ncbi:MAG: ABC transporter permease subunit [Erysipelotrichaceae bacterium]|nr:ABC transporter permease subunit [Erysipelotrichaceae bacterium]
MRNKRLLSAVVLIVLWAVVSSLINKDILLPTPLAVVKELWTIVTQAGFLPALLNTVFRAFTAVFISFVIALLLAASAYRFKGLRTFLEPLYVLFKSVPTVTVIVLALIWLGKEKAAILIVMLVVLPIHYSNILNGFDQIDPDLLKETDTYEDRYLLKLRRIYLPLIRSDLYETLRSTLSLGFKIVIMAEMFAQTRVGIGHELYFLRANLDTTGVFAWTILIVLCSYLFDAILNFFSRRGNVNES